MQAQREQASKQDGEKTIIEHAGSRTDAEKRARGRGGGSTQAQSRRRLSRPRKCSQEGPPHPVVIPQDVEGNAALAALADGHAA